MKHSHEQSGNCKSTSSLVKATPAAGASNGLAIFAPTNGNGMAQAANPANYAAYAGVTNSGRFANHNSSVVIAPVAGFDQTGHFGVGTRINANTSSSQFDAGFFRSSQTTSGFVGGSTAVSPITTLAGRTEFSATRYGSPFAQASLSGSTQISSNTSVNGGVRVSTQPRGAWQASLGFSHEF